MEGERKGKLCPHKWLPGSAVAHLPLIPTPRLTFASSFLCSCLPVSPPILPLFPASSLTLSPPRAHVCTAGTRSRGAGHAYLFLDIFGPPRKREIHPTSARSSRRTRLADVQRVSETKGGKGEKGVEEALGRMRLIVTDRPRS